MKKFILILLSIVHVFNSHCNAQWSQMNGLFNDNITASKTDAVAVDSSHILAATMSGIYLSSDGGSNWQRFSNGMAFSTGTDGAVNYQCLVQAQFPFNSLKIKGNDIYYCGNSSSFSHATFTSGLWVSHSLSGLGNVTDFTYSDSALFISTSDSGVYKSIDNGTTWQGINNGLARWSGGVSCSAIHYQNGKLFVNNYAQLDSLYESDDNGDNWHSIHCFGSNISITCIASYESILIVGSSNKGVYVSFDNGVNWVAANTGFANPSSSKQITSLFRSGNRFFATTNENTYVSDSGVTSWTSIGFFNGTGSSFSSRVLLVDNLSSSNRIKLSNDSGATWKTVNNYTLVNSGVADLAIVGASITAVQGGIATTYNQGNSWSNKTGFGNRVYESSIVTVEGKLFRSYFNRGSLDVSNDTGQTWSTINNVTSIGYSINSLATDGINIYAATLGGVYKSLDLGSTWSKISSANIGLLFSLGSEIYTNAVSKSMDSGQTWSVVNFNIPQFNSVTSMAKIGSNIFLGTEGYDNSGNPMSAGVFKSSDNGITWNHVFTYEATTTMLSVNGLVFAATTNPTQTNGSIYMSADTGNTWYEVDSGIANTNSGRFEKLAADDNYIYCGTWTHGLWRTKISSLTTGVENIGSNFTDIQIYPNPATVSFNINLPANDFNGAKTRFIDIDGKVIFEKQLESPLTKIDLPIQLSSGIYVIQVFSQHNALLGFKKLVIE